MDSALETGQRSESDDSFDDAFVSGASEDRTRSASVSSATGKLESLQVSGEKIGNYILGKTLGEGAFAKVKSAVHSITGARVAVKVLQKTKIKDPYVLRNLRREGELMRRIKHPHVIRLYEIFENEKVYCIVTESADGGEVSIFLSCV